MEAWILRFENSNENQYIVIVEEKPTSTSQVVEDHTHSDYSLVEIVEIDLPRLHNLPMGTALETREAAAEAIYHSPYFSQQQQK
ncbi:MAG TPA: hypothetical protein VG326_14585 [Tepidisphaeraceae bacterium]|jgi:hypothetical protein|nr:hypothetical protein [Tepidisphaeraceae bacterium]